MRRLRTEPSAKASNVKASEIQTSEGGMLKFLDSSFSGFSSCSSLSSNSRHVEQLEAAISQSAVHLSEGGGQLLSEEHTV